MGELCFWCLGELCTHKPAEGSQISHPGKGAQIKAVTAYHGTPCCAACAIDIARIVARLTTLGLARVGTSITVPVMPSSTVMPA